MTACGAGPCPAAGALAELLVETGRVVAQLTTEAYAAPGVPRISGSIGGHVRHCLDHVLALERALETGEVDYDERRRHTEVERDRELAVIALAAAARRLEQIEDAALDRPLAVRSCIAPDGRSVRGRSSVARELAFVISHTIHHHAQIALLADRLGACRLPTRFGLAHSTPNPAGAA
ncbi:MAG: hypothetical protein OEW19_01685 [Acidobacteriota bacterium]|nr:hypothetical protein [Acidobacteriota bacterium]